MPTRIVRLPRTDGRPLSTTLLLVLAVKDTRHLHRWQIRRGFQTLGADFTQTGGALASGETRIPLEPGSGISAARQGTRTRLVTHSSQTFSSFDGRSGCGSQTGSSRLTVQFAVQIRC